MRTLEVDTEFLKSQGIMDYSLYIVVEHLEQPYHLPEEDSAQNTPEQSIKRTTQLTSYFSVNETNNM